MSGLPWFRFYAEAVDDEKLRLLAFEDRWHFVAILCCKTQGVLDCGDPPAMLARKVAVKLGLQLRELEACANRLAELGLIDAETFQPAAWNERQYKSDSSAERVRNFRERLKRGSNVTVTAQEADTETESDTKKEPASACARDLSLSAQEQPEAFVSLPVAGGCVACITNDDLAKYASLYPAIDVPQALRNCAAWLISNPKKRPTATGVLRFVNTWLKRDSDDAAVRAVRSPSARRESLTERVERVNRERQERDDRTFSPPTP